MLKQDDQLKGNSGEDLPDMKSADPSPYKRFQRQDHDQPTTLPGIRRYQSFTNLKHRTPSENLNRLSMLSIAASLGLVITKPLFHGNPQTIYCYECRACYATQDNCPASIQYQAELTISARVADYAKFIRNGGLNCIRCGTCQGFCVQHLDTATIFGIMQNETMKAIAQGKVPADLLVEALRKGMINRDFIDDVAEYLRNRGELKG
jgi:formate hydrogenlyase subunit 6/NADH:ubiquinone oxidoreductase subunit I